MSSTTPSWPSLYNPGLEILHIEHHAAVQPGGAYLYRADDIFRFTFYWTLIFYTPFFFACGLYAFFNYAIPPNRAHVPLRILRSRRSRLLSGEPSPTSPRSPLEAGNKNERRSRLTFGLLVFLTFLAVGLAGAVIGSAVLGFVVMGLYRAGDFNMSTWIPFLLAIIQVLVGLLSIWPSVIEII
ncbi:hypothetical protein AN958_08320 [Leucoagaricus sp. SymC.cos]|nr:hypothetical protein AN958_08320 [Leucoagaricus sp. SymC.cos]